MRYKKERKDVLLSLFFASSPFYLFLSFPFLGVGGDGTCAGYFQRVWNGFENWPHSIDYDVLYGDGVLYHERVFYGGEGEEDEVYADRCTACNGCRDCGKCVVGGGGVRYKHFGIS